jgi:hypothetical protein
MEIWLRKLQLQMKELVEIPVPVVTLAIVAFDGLSELIDIDPDYENNTVYIEEMLY